MTPSAACIAAASVLAKVSRDRMMVAMDAEYPGYGFAEHKGYGTPAHTAALAELGPVAQHRYSFINVRDAWPDRPAPMRGDGEWATSGAAGVREDGATTNQKDS